MAQSTTWQHEPLRIPKGWSGEEKRFAQQIEDLLGDIYSWRNRLRFEDFNQSTQKRIKDTEDNVSTLEQEADRLSLKVSNYDETKLWQAETEAELLEQLDEAGVALTDGILWQDTASMTIKRYNGAGWDTMSTDALRTSFITIENDKLKIGTGGEVSIEAGSSFNLSAGHDADAVGISTERADGYRIWAGAENPEDAPFSVKNTGEVKASSGVVGGFELTEDRLEHGENRVAVSSTGYAKFGKTGLQTDGGTPVFSGEGTLQIRVGVLTMLQSDGTAAIVPVDFRALGDVWLGSLPEINAAANLHVDDEGRLYRVKEGLACALRVNEVNGTAQLTAEGSGGSSYSYEYFYAMPGSAEYISNGGGDTVALTKAGVWSFYAVATSGSATAQSATRTLLKTGAAQTDTDTALCDGAGGSTILTIPHGETVLITGETATVEDVDWYRVMYAGVYGWAAGLVVI